MRISDTNSVAGIRSVAPAVESTRNDKVEAEENISMIDPVVHAEHEAGKDENINEDVLLKSIEQANKSLEKYDRYIERSVHEKTKAIMYVLKDAETNEVIKEFPPKKIQDMIAKMWELAGLFIDEKA